MAGIASTDVTYTVVQLARVDGSPGPRNRNLLTVAFGDGALTYPSGGVPLLKASLGCPNSLEILRLVDPANANGYVYKWDRTNNKLRIYQGDDDNAADAALIELLTSIAPAAASLVVEAVGW